MAPTLATEEGGRRFDGWEIQPRQRVLLVRGEPARIGGRAFDVLLALVARDGQAVSKTELMDAAWPGLVVEENNLSVQISTLRRVLGAGAIVTVSGIGYRLAALPAGFDSGSAALRDGGPDRDAPADSGLIGRESELRILSPRLGVAALLTIVGTGGVGKTALARALLARHTKAWRDGVHWIDLTAVKPGVPLLSTVARVLGVLPDDGALVRGDVLRSLAGAQALVVLDNCEHLLDAAVDTLVPLLRAAPGLHWLVTSQQPLGLTDEEVHRLAPLQVSPPDADPVQVWSCSAMSLFVRRAQLADLNDAADEVSIARAVDICRALDGLPLALEIAAARVLTMGLNAVHEQLGRRLQLRHGRRDAPPRHHTLNDTYTWSYGLLTPTEQRLFRCLQPFQGGFTLGMAEHLAAAADVGAGDVADTLASLLDKSLVQRLASDSPGMAQRYRLLDSARDFARLQLEAVGEYEVVSRRHAVVVASSVDTSWHDLLTSRDADWSARYAPERRNVGAALAWAVEHEDPARLAVLVTACVLIDGLHDTESDAATTAVPLDALRRAPAPLRARAHVELGWVHFLHGNRELGTALIEQALADAEAIGDLVCTWLSLTRLIRLYRGRPGQQQHALSLWERLAALDASQVPLRLQLYCQSTVGRHFGTPTTLAQLQHLAQLARRAGFDVQAAICQTNVTDELLVQGRYEEVVAVAREVLEYRTGEMRLRAFVSYNEAHALVRLGRFAQAREASRRVLRAMPSQAHMVIDLFALALAQQGCWHDAALLAGCSARIKHERDWRADMAEAALIADTLQALQTALAPEERERLFELGASMAVTDVLGIAELD